MSYDLNTTFFSGPNSSIVEMGHKKVTLLKIIVNFPTPNPNIADSENKQKTTPVPVNEALSISKYNPRPKPQAKMRLVSSIRPHAQSVLGQTSLLDLFPQVLFSGPSTGSLSQNRIVSVEAERGNFERYVNEASDSLSVLGKLAKLPTSIRNQNIVTIVAIGGLYLGPAYPFLGGASTFATVAAYLLTVSQVLREEKDIETKKKWFEFEVQRAEWLRQIADEYFMNKSIYLYSCRQNSARIIVVNYIDETPIEQIFPLLGMCDVLVRGKNDCYSYPEKPLEIFVVMSFPEKSYGPPLLGGKDSVLRDLQANFHLNMASKKASIFLEFCSPILNSNQPTRLLLALCQENNPWEETLISFKKKPVPEEFREIEKMAYTLEKYTQSAIPLISDFCLCLELCIEKYEKPEKEDEKSNPKQFVEIKDRKLKNPDKTESQEPTLPTTKSNLWSKTVNALRSAWGAKQRVNAYIPIQAGQRTNFTLEVVRRIQKLIKSLNQRVKSVDFNITQSQLVEIAFKALIMSLNALSESDTSSFDPLENSEFEKESDLAENLNDQPILKPLRIFNENPKSEIGVVKKIPNLEDFQSSNYSLDLNLETNKLSNPDFDSEIKSSDTIGVVFENLEKPESGLKNKKEKNPEVS